MHRLLRHQTSITLDLAMQALQAALAQAASDGVRISIVIVDASAQPIHSAHMDGAPAQCRDIALGKARSAAGFGCATGDWQERLERCSPAVRQGLPLQAGLVLFGGGEPFRLGSEVLGAIGVSGASEQVDVRCAQAAVERVQSLLDS